MPKLETEDSSPSVELSQQTLDKFAEIDKAVEQENETPEAEPQTTARSPRAGDEGMNEDGTLKLDEEEPEAKEPEETPAEEAPPEEVSEEPKEEKPPTEIRSGEEVTLPNRLIQAGYRSGLDDDEIAALGPNAGKVLSKLADNADALSTKYGEIGRTLQQKPPEPPPENLLDLTPPPERSEFEAEPEDKRFKKVAESFNALQGQLKTIEERLAESEAARTTAFIDSFLDPKAKDYPELGDGEVLTDAQMNTRREIAQQADFIIRGAASEGVKIPARRALDMAFSIYEGKNAKTTVRSNLVKEAKERSKQISARPTRRKTEQKFSTPVEQAMDAVRKWHSDKGMTQPVDED